jgi:hypothetical protein
MVPPPEWAAAPRVWSRAASMVFASTLILTFLAQLLHDFLEYK